MSSHEEDRFYADAAHTGGVWLFGPGNLIDYSTSTLATIVRNGAQSWSLNRTAGGAETHFMRGSFGEIRRLPEGVALQQQFGGAVGPLPVPGRPPFVSGVGSVPWLTPPTSSAPVSKGVQIIDVTLSYSVTVAALTSIALTLNTATFANNVAISGATIALAASPTLPTATQTNPYVTKIPVVTPVFNTTDLQDVWPELQVVMQNTGVFQLFWMILHLNFNYD